ncbi:hypothetical protein ACFY20_37710 [Streptomyces sp. NPDC001312]|uniref:hypothetical protein n=1 Tax=Streptomyces sp. NPDC001312 TaxID=3364561 RepID=UPI003692EA45
MGAVLSGYLTQLTAGAAAYTEADGTRLATCTLHLLTPFLAHHLASSASVPPQTRQPHATPERQGRVPADP